MAAIAEAARMNLGHLFAGMALMAVASCDILYGPWVWNRSGADVSISFNDAAGNRIDTILPPCGQVGRLNDNSPISDFRMVLPDGREERPEGQVWSDLFNRETVAIVSPSGVDYVPIGDASVDDNCKN